MRGKWKHGTDFVFLGFKTTVDGDCSREIKRCMLLGRKAIINLESVLKSRDITLPTKVHLVKVMVFPVVMYGVERYLIVYGNFLFIFQNLKNIFTFYVSYLNKPI